MDEGSWSSHEASLDGSVTSRLLALRPVSRLPVPEIGHARCTIPSPAATPAIVAGVPFPAGLIWATITEHE
jgi:hypothetical protein